MQVSTLNNRIQPVDDFNQEKGYDDFNADLLMLFHNSIILKLICLTEPKQRNREVHLGLFFFIMGSCSQILHRPAGVILWSLILQAPFMLSGGHNSSLICTKVTKKEWTA